MLRNNINLLRNNKRRPLRGAVTAHVTGDQRPPWGGRDEREEEMTNYAVTCTCPSSSLAGGDPNCPLHGKPVETVTFTSADRVYRGGAVFRDELSGLLNRYSRENHSDTPDFLLAQYLERCLDAFDEAVIARESWYGRDRPAPGR